MAITDAPKCRHQQEDGACCQRPALRRLRLCDHHHREHKRNAKRIAERARQRWFESVALDDPQSIQKALAQVMQLLLDGEIDQDRAAQLLGKLQMASLKKKRSSPDCGAPLFGTAKSRDPIAAHPSAQLRAGSVKPPRAGHPVRSSG
jgi:hypothetical protein